mmetsp:Transcript_11827/g.19706  ORF Transcript_11827/g.19706 Transcript_11827/m.19706 type:complete len:214 (-) Transcript_11827:107-748(-)
MCLFCFSGDPLSPDEAKGKYGSAFGAYAGNSDKFEITLCQAPFKACPCWISSMLCFPCAQTHMRKKALNHIEPGSGWSNYKCCQGYFGGCCCLQPGKCGDSACPVPCMCLEACCCPGLAASTNSMLIRDKYGLGLDEDDVRLIRCSNCLMCFAVILSCIGICFDWDGERACINIVNGIADVTFCCVSGCMTAQCNYEIERREEQAPQTEAMER